MKICPCGSEITKDQHCVETPGQFAKRYNSGYCRSKCKRTYAPPKAESGKPTLELISNNHGPVESICQPKEKTPRDEGFRDFVRTFDCVECGWPAHLGEIEAHHIETGGASLKCSDYLEVPLCSIKARGCHAKADKSPESSAEYRPIALMLQTLWIKAGHKIKK